MNKILFLLLLILPPLSIKAQKDSLNLKKDSLFRFVRITDTAAFFIAEVDGYSSYLNLKIEHKATADSMRAGLIPLEYQEKLKDFKDMMLKKSQQRDSLLKTLVHTRIPDFDAPDTMGFIHRPMQYRGKVLILHFFNFWDYSFENEIPVLNNLLEQYQKNGLEILSFTDIAIGESEKRILQRKPIQFPLVANARNFMKTFLPIEKAIPYLIIVDKLGHFRYFYSKNELSAEKNSLTKDGSWLREYIKTDFKLTEKIAQLLEEY
jgi:peroxiredoxin